MTLPGGSIGARSSRTLGLGAAERHGASKGMPPADAAATRASQREASVRAVGVENHRSALRGDRWRADDVSVIRVDTNQGLVGWGEVRDGSSETYALMLKSRILGENPCNVDRIFRKIKQFGGPARQAGGVCGIEMAMMDLAGKAWGVPCWQMLGGKFRDRVRLYADTTERETAKEQGEMLKARMDRGITFLKQDFGIDLLRNVPGTLSMPVGTGIGGGERVMHPFTGITITDKGIAWLSDWVGQIRETIGMEIPLASDHYGHIGGEQLHQARARDGEVDLAWMEDMVPWEFRRAPQADQGLDDDAAADGRGHSISRKTSSS
jgi:L-alanine-DL-glutamate epimerase-like enolase superfamily enzyme